MLTADAFGVMPPIAKLTPAQAMYHFLSGYTAKVAGTEKGLVGVQPEFSTCFGAPFLPRPPAEYGNLLREYIAEHEVDCWLVNSGWTGGKYGVGRRMPIKATRALLTAALDGSLKNASFRTDPYFGFSVPTSVPGVEPHLLYPMKTWKDKAEFDETARKLVKMFQDNFVKFEKDGRCRRARRGAGSAARGGVRTRQRNQKRAATSAALFFSRACADEKNATGALRLLAERIEARLLLVRERSVEFLQRRLHGLAGLHHRLQPLLHRFQPADRSERNDIRAGGHAGIPTACRSRPFSWSSALAAARSAARCVFDPLDRQIGQARLLASARLCVLLLQPARAARARSWPIFRADRGEARLLLVRQRIVERLERGPHDAHGLQVASSRLVIACRRPGGVSGKSVRARRLERLRGFGRGAFTSSRSLRCSAFGRTACSICANGHDVMPLPASLQICASVRCAGAAGSVGGADPVV